VGKYKEMRFGAKLFGAERERYRNSKSSRRVLAIMMMIIFDYRIMIAGMVAISGLLVRSCGEYWKDAVLLACAMHLSEHTVATFTEWKSAANRVTLLSVIIKGILRLFESINKAGSKC